MSVTRVKGTSVAVNSVVCRFDSVVALAGIDLSVQDGELLTILGPSGSGKSTLLRVIAGFQYPDEGSVYLAGEDITDRTPAKRDIGMVFQNYALFPHLTVAQNIAFPLQMRKVKKAERERRIEEVLEMVDLSGYGQRLPRQLSGGQQQRVALARAIVFGPRLLLLDEPFGALDRKLREQMQLEVRRLQRKLGLTTVFVTHDQEEALILSDRIAVMESGNIAQIGTPHDIYMQPASRFVAGFIGESNLLRSRITGPGVAHMDTGVELAIPDTGCAASDEVGVLLRPDRIRRLTASDSCDTRLTGKVVEVVYLGETIKYRVRVHEGLDLVVRWPLDTSDGALQLNEEVHIGWSRNEAHVVPW